MRRMIERLAEPLLLHRKIRYLYRQATRHAVSEAVLLSTTTTWMQRLVKAAVVGGATNIRMQVNCRRQCQWLHHSSHTGRRAAA